ncbi:MAG: TetR family transcriptional regulator [Segniliparus sp.]|uniref:TetR/AcrR family transcriptional regulator n=1 Tax=Segniliparus sp. TaxID=2804064 RepID=UPI003F2F15B5
MRLENGRAGRAEDLNARARIRDAAIVLVGRHGFGVSVRAIAEAAGTSAGLVIHHFGSKAGLRAACDEEVLRRYREAKTDAMQTGASGTFAHSFMAHSAQVREHAPMVAYLLRALAEGGPLAEEVIEKFALETEQILEAGVASGQIRPSRDPKARARYLAIESLGGMLLRMRPALDADGDLGDGRFGDALVRYASEITLPALEVFTEGLIADPSFYAAFLAKDKENEDTENEDTEKEAGHGARG